MSAAMGKSNPIPSISESTGPTDQLVGFCSIAQQQLHYCHYLDTIAAVTERGTLYWFYSNCVTTTGQCAGG